MYPALIEIGSVAVSSLWFFVAVGFTVSGMLFIKLAIRNKLKIAFLTEHFFRILLWGLVLSRIAYVLFNYQEYFSEGSTATITDILSIWDKGLSYWGAVIGIAYAFYRYTKKKEEPLVKWLDMLVLALLCGMIFGNIGAFLEGINYGKETTLPWGMTFQNFYIPYTIPIHPSQLYALIYTGALFTIFLTLFLKGKFKHDGDIALYATFSYSILRFLEEFTRGEETYMFLGLRFEQWTFLLATIGTGILIALRYNTARSYSEISKNNTNEIS